MISFFESVFLAEFKIQSVLSHHVIVKFNSNQQLGPEQRLLGYRNTLSKQHSMQIVSIECHPISEIIYFICTDVVLACPLEFRVADVNRNKNDKIAHDIFTEIHQKCYPLLSYSKGSARHTHHQQLLGFFRKCSKRLNKN